MKKFYNIIIMIHFFIFFLYSTSFAGIIDLIFTPSEIRTIKNGTLSINENITVGEAFEKYKIFRNTSWKVIKDGTVEFKGEYNIEEILDLLDNEKSLFLYTCDMAHSKYSRVSLDRNLDMNDEYNKIHYKSNDFLGISMYEWIQKNKKNFGNASIIIQFKLIGDDNFIIKYIGINEKEKKTNLTLGAPLVLDSIYKNKIMNRFYLPVVIGFIEEKIITDKEYNLYLKEQRLEKINARKEEAKEFLASLDLNTVYINDGEASYSPRGPKFLAINDITTNNIRFSFYTGTFDNPVKVSEHTFNYSEPELLFYSYDIPDDFMICNRNDEEKTDHLFCFKFKNFTSSNSKGERVGITGEGKDIRYIKYSNDADFFNENIISQRKLELRSIIERLEPRKIYINTRINSKNDYLLVINDINESHINYSLFRRDKKTGIIDIVMNSFASYKDTTNEKIIFYNTNREYRNYDKIVELDINSIIKGNINIELDSYGAYDELGGKYVEYKDAYKIINEQIYNKIVISDIISKNYKIGFKYKDDSEIYYFIINDIKQNNIYYTLMNIKEEIIENGMMCYTYYNLLSNELVFLTQNVSIFGVNQSITMKDDKIIFRNKTRDVLYFYHAKNENYNNDEFAIKKDSYEQDSNKNDNGIVVKNDSEFTIKKYIVFNDELYNIFIKNIDFRNADEKLNNIWRMIKKTVPKKEFNKIRKEQMKWLSEGRDKAANIYLGSLNCQAVEAFTAATWDRIKELESLLSNYGSKN